MIDETAAEQDLLDTLEALFALSELNNCSESSDSFNLFVTCPVRKLQFILSRLPEPQREWEMLKLKAKGEFFLYSILRALLPNNISSEGEVDGEARIH